MAFSFIFDFTEEYAMKRSTILTIFSGIGMLATVVLAVKATPKALELIEEHKNVDSEEIKPIDAIKIAWKPYIPALAVGSATILCMFGSDFMTKRKQANLIGAYTLLENSYKSYKNKVKDIYGEEADSSIKTEIAKDEYEDANEPCDENDDLFFDFATLRYFRAPMSEVVQKVTMDDGMECYIISTPFDSSTNFNY